MRIVCLQHVEYEGPGAILDWARNRGHELTIVTPLFEEYPVTGTFDMLVVMGGPMGAYEAEAYPWLASEIAFISEAVTSGALVLGICLGCQLLARAIGGVAHPHTLREVGWLPARLTPAGRASRMLSALPDDFLAGLWHGDTYDLPADVETAAVTDGCANQAFEYADGRAVGLQFHPEWTPEILAGLVERHGEWLSAGVDSGPYVRTAAQLLDAGEAFTSGRGLLFDLLDRMEAIA